MAFRAIKQQYNCIKTGMMLADFQRYWKKVDAKPITFDLTTFIFAVQRLQIRLAIRLVTVRTFGLQNFLVSRPHDLSDSVQKLDNAKIFKSSNFFR